VFRLPVAGLPDTPTLVRLAGGGVRTGRRRQFRSRRHDADATVLKPTTKSLWGYGGVVRAPDATICKIVTSAKKDTGPANHEINVFVLLIGVEEDVKATAQFYVGRGSTVAR
jgi:hypothetical protein